MNSSNANCTQYPDQYGLEAPATVAEAGRFFVTLTEEFHNVRSGLLPRGVHLLIDPAVMPEDCDTVLIGNRLEAYMSQPGILGVAVQYNQTFR